MRKPVKVLAFAVAFAVATSAAAQLPKQSNAPTSKDFRLRVLEPLPGAKITGNDFNVVVGGPPEVPSGASVSSSERKDALTPIYQVWVDGKDFGNINPGQNVLAIHTDGFGPHQIVVAAKNTAGELIDRQEISVTTNAPVMESSRVTTMQEQKAPAPAPVAAAPPAPAPAPSLPAETYTSASSTLPKTASPYPAVALAGLILAGTGLVLRRRL